MIPALAALAVARILGTTVHQAVLPNVAFSDSALGTRMLWFTLVATVVTGVLTGLVPALQSTRTELVDASAAPRAVAARLARAAQGPGARRMPCTGDSRGGSPASRAPRCAFNSVRGHRRHLRRGRPEFARCKLEFGSDKWAAKWEPYEALPRPAGHFRQRK